MTTLEQFFNRKLDAKSAAKLLDRQRSPIDEPSNSEEFVLSRVGRELYEAFYLNYTLKQWEIHPRDLAASVCGRIPVRFNRDNRYVDHRYQIMPKLGFTAMFGRMIDHPRIRVLTGADFAEVQAAVTPRHATVTSGPVDEYFDYRFGKLPYRSLRFEMATFHEEYRQPCVQVNFPNDFGYTRSVETKHITGQKHPETVITYETPEANGDRYYPIPMAENAALYKKYQALAEDETRRRQVYFCGRLAQYKYLNTDEVIGEALRGLDDPRGALSIHSLRAIGAIQPRYFVLENVTGFGTSNGGEGFEAFAEAAGKLGYAFASNTLDARYFGLPQTRPGRVPGCGVGAVGKSPAVATVESLA